MTNNAVLLYNGSAADDAAISLAITTKAASVLIIIPNAGGQGVLIMEQGTP